LYPQVQALIAALGGVLVFPEPVTVNKLDDILLPSLYSRVPKLIGNIPLFFSDPKVKLPLPAFA
jgi:hypothetical protein